MRKYVVVALALIGATMFFSNAPAMAQATRTWVSGVGDDANPCSRTAPCKTFAGAISKTVAGGEIDALDPGGFGAVTITKPITLDGGGGQVASILVAGTNGITVAAGSGDTVIIRNLRLDGLQCSTPAAPGCTGSPGLTGISFLSGAVLIVENCVIFGFNTSGINASLGANATLNVINTTITNIGTCAPASCAAGQGVGIFVTTTSGVLIGEIDHTTIQETTNAGIQAANAANFTITNSTITHTATGVIASGSTTRVNVDTSSVSNNTTALNASVSGAIIRAANNVLLDNSTNFATTGTIQSTGNNRSGGGGGSPNGTYTQQ